MFKKSFFIGLIAFSSVLSANPLLDFLSQEIERKEQAEKIAQSKAISKPAVAKAAPAEEKRYFKLSNGKSLEISEWAIVHFMSSTCSYCRSFDPKLKQISLQTGIPVYAYSFDGIGDESFPEVLSPTEEELSLFFAELPRATPTSFLVHINNLTAIPISQGDISTYAFVQRLDETFLYVDKNLRELMRNAK